MRHGPVESEFRTSFKAINEIKENEIKTGARGAGSAGAVTPQSLFAKHDITSQTGGFIANPNNVVDQKLIGSAGVPVLVSESKRGDVLAHLKTIDEYLTKQCYLCGDVLLDMIESAKFGCQRKPNN